MLVSIEKQVQKAIESIRHKSIKQLQAEAAMTWAMRACAAARLKRAEDAQEFAHEAIEHAALCGDDKVLALVRAILKSHGMTVP